MASEGIVLRTGAPDDTRAAAGAIAGLLVAGDTVVLGGELGAGKTCFVQGAAAALGVTRRVTSPTFTLVRTYPEANPPLVHCDVYRLDRLHDVMDLGDEVFADDAVTFVEWGDAIRALLPTDRLDVELALIDPRTLEGARRIVIRPHGRFAALADTLREVTSGWLDESGDR